MCGIFAVIGSALPRGELERVVREATGLLRHRGPDEFQTFVSEDGWAALGFARLAIVDPEHGHQPMQNEAGTVVAVTNGELYNHEALHAELLGKCALSSRSDCAIVVPLYEQMVIAAARAQQQSDDVVDAARAQMYDVLRGVFANVTVDLARGEFLAARDPVGVRGMFIGTSAGAGAGAGGAVWFASEAKALAPYCDHVEAFAPGCFVRGRRGREQADLAFRRWYTPRYLVEAAQWTPSARADLRALHDAFTLAVKRRLMADVPLGVFISGGLDSSLVAAVAKRLLPAEYTLHSFACGLAGSPDLEAARRVAAYLGTTHHELVFTVEQGVAALRDVIYHLETYDVTTVRASTPMYLLSATVNKYCKVILSGEGADEVFGGYLYFHNAPSAREFQRETVRRVRLLYTADVLRGDRSTAAQSLELRVPFLDRDFLDVAMSIDPAEKMCRAGGRMEKHIMRAAFDPQHCTQQAFAAVDASACARPYLPHDILWRQKEQFSDGVGYSWIDGLRAHCARIVSDAQLARAAERFPHDPPATKEAYHYRQLFEELYGGRECVARGLRASVHPWVPMWSDATDPSGRAQRVHAQAYQKQSEGGAPAKAPPAPPASAAAAAATMVAGDEDDAGKVANGVIVGDIDAVDAEAELEVDDGDASGATR